MYKRYEDLPCPDCGGETVCYCMNPAEVSYPLLEALGPVTPTPEPEQVFYSRHVVDGKICYYGTNDERVILDDWQPHTNEEIAYWHNRGLATPAPQRPKRVRY